MFKTKILIILIALLALYGCAESETVEEVIGEETIEEVQEEAPTGPHAEDYLDEALANLDAIEI